jgi:hypothetical protein
MKRLILFTVIAAGVSSAFAQTSQASASGTASGAAQVEQSQAQAGTAIQAELTKGLDARKLTEGDAVIAKLSQEFRGKGDLRIPKNAKLFGRVTQVQARGKGQSSSVLAIAFDRAQLKDGREIPINAVIQAIAPPVMATDTSLESMGSVSAPAPTGRTGAGVLGTATSAVNSGTATTGNVASGLTQNVTAENLTANAGVPNSSFNADSSGVIGLKGLQLDASSSSSAGTSVIHSSSDNVRLESGTRLVLRMTAQ